MKTIKWRCETGYPGCEHEGEFEVEDNASEDEINEAVMEDIFNYITWTWWEENG